MSDATNETVDTQLLLDFSPYNQTFTLILADGTPFEANMSEIEFLRQWGIRLAINYGSQIGASMILLMVLVVLTRQEKRKSAIFIMNVLCLALNACRSVVLCLYLTGKWFEPYAFISGDFSGVTNVDIANTVAANTLTLAVYICVMISLSLQVWVVCITTQKRQRILIMSVTTLFALAAVGLRFSVCVISNMQSMQMLGMDNYDKLLTATTVVTTVAIWVYCVVFTIKLGFALLQRRRLGMTQFGPMQIIFIMGCQTMIIPAIFSALQFYDNVPELGSQTLTIVCVSLPLSAIWAGVIASDKGIGSSGADSHQRLLRDNSGRSASTTLPGSNGSKVGDRRRGTIDSGTFADDFKEPDTPSTLATPRKADHLMDEGGIHIDREWSVEKGEASNSC